MKPSGKDAAAGKVNITQRCRSVKSIRPAARYKNSSKVKEVCDRIEARLVHSFYTEFIATFLLLYEEHLCSFCGSEASAEGRCSSAVTNIESRGLQFVSATITCQVEIFLKS